MNNYFHRQIIQ